MKKVLARLVVVVVLAGLGWAGWAYFGESGMTFWRGTRPDDTRLVLFGNVDIRKVDLAFRIGGRIETMAAQEGDPVKPGQTLATIEPTPYEEDVREAEAAVAALQSALEKLRAGYRSQEVAAQESLVVERRATLENARQQLERQKELLKTSTASRQAYDNAVATEKEGAARLESALRQLQLLRSGFRKEEVAEAEAQLRGAQVRLDRARTRLADTALSAPEGGIVLTRVREQGSVISAGQTVYSVSLTDPVWVRAYISEPNLARIKPGMAAEVSADGRPGKVYPAQVGYISPQAEFTPKTVETTDQRTDLVYRLRLVVTDPDGELRQGMPVTAVFPVAAAPEK